MPSPVPRSPAVLFLQIYRKGQAGFGHKLESAGHYSASLWGMREQDLSAFKKISRGVSMR